MPQHSRWSVSVPEVSISTYIFGSPYSPLSNHVAFVDNDDPSRLYLTWSTLRHWSQRFAAGLINAGIQKGDRILVYSPNSVFVPVLFHGTIMAGGIYSAANARFVPRELAYQLQTTQATVLLVSPRNLKKALEAAKYAGLAREKVFLFDEAPLLKQDGGEDDKESGVRHWKYLISSEEVGRQFQWEDITGEEAKKRTVGLSFSSGTTGLPKGVEGSHYNLIAGSVQAEYVMSLDSKTRTRELATQNCRWLCTIPLYHGLGLFYFMVIAPSRRIPTYIMSQYNLNRMISAIERHKITELHLVPPIIVEMTQHQGIRNGQVDLSSVTTTLSCGAPLGPEVSLEYERLWPEGVMNVKQAFGMTELCGISLGCDPNLPAVPGSVGEPMPNVEVKLVDDNHKEVTTGDFGEMWVRSPSTMKGYWQNLEATDDTITADGWLKTGDIAVVDRKGCYYIIDRKKELIKVKGNQVAPAELEALLLDHPAVADVAVIGVKSDQDEAPRAYIVPASPISEKDIHDYVNDRVQSIKRLHGGVYFTSTIPRNPSGKILRRLIRDQANSKKIGLKPQL
ncbi:putative 4-coumarate-CoA ligase [Boeremia exigua]|uniref:putative 4-coumarate-CoA ligase n=1 Tax=Boeremia exigua TaxID=749465 RepID=UPI001E8ECF20|nr:putative 4-coumarate-CoA ligase [Boeremia exigua]KAH6644898.1 putative 4-coumarate-CoA ligase [Boeremia exigua]